MFFPSTFVLPLNAISSASWDRCLLWVTLWSQITSNQLETLTQWELFWFSLPFLLLVYNFIALEHPECSLFQYIIEICYLCSYWPKSTKCPWSQYSLVGDLLACLEDFRSSRQAVRMGLSRSCLILMMTLVSWLMELNQVYCMYLFPEAEAMS